MSVYTELLRVGLREDVAQDIADTVQRGRGVVTVDVLDARLAQLEARITRAILTAVVSMTGIFAVFVGAMAWAVGR